MNQDYRRLHYVIARSLLHKLNAPNLMSDLEHYMLQYIVIKKPANFLMILIHHMVKNTSSLGGLITVILKNQKIEIGDAKFLEAPKG